MSDSSKKYIHEKRKVIALVILVIFCLCAGFSSYIIIHGRTTIVQQTSRQEKDIQTLVRILEQSSTEKYKKRIKSFFNIKASPGREKIIKAFADKDRQEVLRLSRPYFQLFTKEDQYFLTFVWFLADNHVFLRVPIPEMFGDDISLVRPDVAKTNRDYTPTSGYLTAYSGLDYRIIEPVIYKGKHLGAVQFGLRDSFLIDAISSEIQVPVAQVMPREKFKIVTFSKIPHIHSGAYTIQSYNMDSIQHVVNDIDWSLDKQQVFSSGRAYVVSKIKTLNNYKGEPEGWIFSFLDVTAQRAQMRAGVIEVVLASVILIVLISLLITRSYDKLILRIDGLNNKLLNTNLLLEDKIQARTTELRNEQEKLYVTLRSIGDGVITTDMKGNIVLINKVTEQLTGWSQQEALGQPLQKIFNIINEETRKPCENPVNKVLQSKQIIGLANHTALISRNGTVYSIEDSGAPIFDMDSNIIGTVLVFRDVTEEKITAKELLKIEKLESVGLLAGGIAHDFNNILTAILGNIELAGMCMSAKSEAYPLLQEAAKASVRAKELTQQLLTFSKGGDPIRKTSSIAEMLTSSAKFVLHGSQVSCAFNIPADLFLVDIDAGQISQVIQNLVINAKHAMPDGGQISITCSNVNNFCLEPTVETQPQSYVKIVVKDTGSGISEQRLQKIFDPYFTTKQEGSGLGLAISHSIIKKHHGQISVQSKIDHGTTFTIYLPASDTQKITVAPPTSHDPAASSGTIMIMDDDSCVQDIACQILERLGHRVLLANDGTQAIEIFRQYQQAGQKIDIIIMDLTIPGGMGGKEALDEILKIDSEAKAIVSSGYSNDPIMANCKKFGFKAAISKPFLLADLQKVINKVLF